MHYHSKDKITEFKKSVLYIAVENNNIDMIEPFLQNKDIDINALFFKKGKIIKDNHDYAD